MSKMDARYLLTSMDGGQIEAEINQVTVNRTGVSIADYPERGLAIFVPWINVASLRTYVPKRKQGVEPDVAYYEEMDR